MNYFAPKEEDCKIYNVYLRNNNGGLGKFHVAQKDHEEAILDVKQHLVRSGEGYDDPVLVCLPGGKYAN